MDGAYTESLAQIMLGSQPISNQTKNKARSSLRRYISLSRAPFARSLPTKRENGHPYFGRGQIYHHHQRLDHHLHHSHFRRWPSSVGHPSTTMGLWSRSIRVELHPSAISIHSDLPTATRQRLIPKARGPSAHVQPLHRGRPRRPPAATRA